MSELPELEHLRMVGDHERIEEIRRLREECERLRGELNNIIEELCPWYMDAPGETESEKSEHVIHGILDRSRKYRERAEKAEAAVVKLRTLCGEAADVYEAETVTNPAVIGRPIADWRREFIRRLRAAAKGGEDGR